LGAGDDVAAHIYGSGAGGEPKDGRHGPDVGPIRERLAGAEVPQRAERDSLDLDLNLAGKSKMTRIPLNLSTA